MIYGSWDMKCDRQNFLSFWTIFCSFTLFNNPKNQNFEKLKKRPGDITILHKYTKNHDHMLYYSLDMVLNGFNCYFSFWAIFYPSTSLTAQIIKIQKKWRKKKKPLEISSFYMCVPTIMIRWCTVTEIWCAMDGRTDRKSDRWVPHLKTKEMLYHQIILWWRKKMCCKACWDLC